MGTNVVVFDSIQNGNYRLVIDVFWDCIMMTDFYAISIDFYGLIDIYASVVEN